MTIAALKLGCKSLFLLCLLMCLSATAPAANLAPTPNVSAFAPIDELVGLIESYVAECLAKTKDEAAYKAGEAQVERNAHTLCVLGTALALHDQEAPLKKLAGGIVAAAAKLAECSSFDESQQAIAELATALKLPVGDAPLPGDWQTSASMAPLMKQVAFLNGKLRRGARGSRFATTADENARHATVLAVIAQAVSADTTGIEGDEKQRQWQDFCEQMRGEAAAAHAALKAKDPGQTTAALGRLEQSCKACHQVFKPDLPESSE